MEKAGVRRPDPEDPKNQGIENRHRPNYQNNDIYPAVEIQGRVKYTHRKAGVI